MKKEIVDAIAALEVDGRLTPDAVIEEAANANSPLHELFEWDDGLAAHKYRVEQARKVIRDVKVTFTVDSQKITAVAYVRDPDAGKHQGYVSVAKVKSNVDEAREIVFNEFSTARSHLKRAENIASVLGVKDDVTNLIEKVETLRSFVQKDAA